MRVRRVVTGHTPDGKAVFASDEEVEPVTLAALPGYEFHKLWGGDEPPSFPDSGAQADYKQYFPPVGGFRFGSFTVPPESSVVVPADLDPEAALAAMQAALPGMADHMEPDAPGMHTTATVDYEWVVSGRIVLELDDGASVELSAGDTVVQNGTRHAWRNPFDEPCTLVVVLLGAHHAKVHP
jgi:mannose-6-phosphate isomerase-like protein (cupin superfamily)